MEACGHRVAFDEVFARVCGVLEGGVVFAVDFEQYDGD